MSDTAATSAFTETTTNWRRTSPVAVLFFFGRMLKMAFDAGWAAIAPIFAAVSSGNSVWILPGVFIILGLFAGWAVLSWLRFRYRLKDDKLLVRRGVLHREKLTIEFEKVQNTRVLEPFYVRPFGLAVFELDTAGSAGKEVTLGGIDLALARQLRDSVVVEKSPVHEALDDTDSAAVNPGAQLILSRTPGEIARYGLTHNGLLWVAVLFGALFSQIDWDDSSFFRAVSRSIDFSSLGLWVFFLLAFAIALVLPLLSIAGAFWRYHDYRLFKDGQTWRRHSGLASKHDESIKQHKIQTAIWKQNFVARMFGRINMQLRQVSAGVAAGANGSVSGIGKGRGTFIIPVLKPLEAAELTAQLLPDAQVWDTDFTRVHRRYVRKTLMWGWSWVCALICIAPVIFLGWLALLLWPALMFLAWLIVTQYWRKMGYAIRGGYGLFRTGFMGSETTVFPLFKVQRVDLLQSPSQRRHNLAHLRVHLASHSVTLPWIELADATKMRDLILYHVETSRKNWF